MLVAFLLRSNLPRSYLLVRAPFWNAIYFLTHTSLEAIRDVIDLAFMLLRSKSRKKSNEGFKCAVSKMELEW
jgi:hypothetical protein